MEEEILDDYTYDNKNYKVKMSMPSGIDGEEITVRPSIAKQYIKEFITEQFMVYVDGVHQISCEMLDMKIAEVQANLIKLIDDKVDSLVETIVTEIVSSKFKEIVNDKVKEKLSKITEKLME